MMNEFLGTRFKIVTGYAGGNEINLAMERGEVEARNNTWSSWKATKAAWLKDNKITVIVQAGPRAPDLDVPSVEELARIADDRKLIELVVSGTRLGRPMATTPDVPEDRWRRCARPIVPRWPTRRSAPRPQSLNFEVAPVYGEDMQNDRRRGDAHAEGAGRPRQASVGVSACRCGRSGVICRP